jgi:hypothetical protein
MEIGIINLKMGIWTNNHKIDIKAKIKIMKEEILKEKNDNQKNLKFVCIIYLIRIWKIIFRVFYKKIIFK